MTRRAVKELALRSGMQGLSARRCSAIRSSEERQERTRRLRFSGRLLAQIRMDFSAAAKERGQRANELGDQGKMLFAAVRMCGLAGIAPRIYRYRSCRPDDAPLRKRLKELAAHRAPNVGSHFTIHAGEAQDRPHEPRLQHPPAGDSGWPVHEGRLLQTPPRVFRKGGAGWS
jgi:hypothetical protein